MGIDPFSPSEEQVQVLEESLERFNNAPLARLRDRIQVGFLASWLSLFVLLFLAGLVSGIAWWLAGFFGTAGLSAIVAYSLISGISDRTYLFDRVLAWLFSLRWSSWLTVIAGVLLSLPVLWLLGWLTPFILGGSAGIGLGAAFYLAIDRPLAASRREALAELEGLLKSLRINGVDEAAQRAFVIDYSGVDWEEFYETLFGYPAKLQAREEIARTGQVGRKHKFRDWRDPLIRMIDARLSAQREALDRKHSQKVEEERLKDEGFDEIQARQQEARVAEALAGERAAARDEKPLASSGQPVDPKMIAAAKRSRQLKMLAEARSGAHSNKRTRLGGLALRLVTGPLAFALSGKVRFLAGALLIAAFVFWLRENGVSAPTGEITRENAQQQAVDLLAVIKNVAFGEAPLQLPIPIVGPLLSSLGAGIAGLILLVLGLFRGWKMSLFAWPAAIVALLVPGTLGYGIAAALAVVGLFFGRTYEE